MTTATPDESLDACLATLRRLDHDRFLAALVAPAAKRPALVALYAFNAEIARVRETVSEPMLGQIRLQWWRESIEALERGEARGHEVIVALELAKLPAACLITLVDARERDLDDEPFADMAALETYAEATSSALMRLATLALGGEDHPAIRPAGIAYALTGLLRAVPAHASQGRLYLPLDLLREHDVDPHRIFAGEMSEGLRSVVNAIAARARGLLAEARGIGKVGRASLPALLPAALCDRYLDIMTAPDFDPFRRSTDVPAFRRQLRLLGRSFAGRF
ncbi:MAG: phytoene/squalene synthase family protein [Parvibaculum sp.]|uniref:phytoene/squalene synthase family protein n=1 Tax=Parvibaculum sp. TaxID=2024848 RepID=UPI00284EFD84|nr:phytoene/squalene synthase family protein [Parvibaculum sp.]MDR3500847.1 phytoene/squalene synthase family protein [Parvibaculum sp.]